MEVIIKNYKNWRLEIAPKSYVGIKYETSDEDRTLFLGIGILGFYLSLNKWGNRKSREWGFTIGKEYFNICWNYDYTGWDESGWSYFNDWKTVFCGNSKYTEEVIETDDSNRIMSQLYKVYILKVTKYFVTVTYKRFNFLVAEQGHRYSIDVLDEEGKDTCLPFTSKPKYGMNDSGVCGVTYPLNGISTKEEALNKFIKDANEGRRKYYHNKAVLEISKGTDR